jgi:cytochrome b pre-mRNA-processing protein 3
MGQNPMISIPFLKRRPDPIAALYGDIVAAARAPRAFLEFGVSDDFEGRFEYLALVTTLVLRRLKALPAPADAMGQLLVDRVFDELDDGLRRLGVGDLSVGKRVKKLAKGFYGRAAAYTGALDSGDVLALREALSRNLLGSRIAPADVPESLLGEIAAMKARLDDASLEALLSGEIVARGKGR